MSATAAGIIDSCTPIAKPHTAAPAKAKRKPPRKTSGAKTGDTKVSGTKLNMPNRSKSLPKTSDRTLLTPIAMDRKSESGIEAQCQLSGNGRRSARNRRLRPRPDQCQPGRSRTPAGTPEDRGFVALAPFLPAPDRSIGRSRVASGWQPQETRARGTQSGTSGSAKAVSPAGADQPARRPDRAPRAAQSPNHSPSPSQRGKSSRRAADCEWLFRFFP